MLDIQKLTIGELAFLEDTLGMPINRMDEAPQSKVLTAMVMLTKKRQGEKVTAHDVAKMSMEEVTEILGLEDDADPKDDE